MPEFDRSAVLLQGAGFDDLSEAVEHLQLPGKVLGFEPVAEGEGAFARIGVDHGLDGRFLCFLHRGGIALDDAERIEGGFDDVATVRQVAGFHDQAHIRREVDP